MKIKVYVDGRRMHKTGKKEVYLRFKPEGKPAFLISCKIQCEYDPVNFEFPRQEPNAQTKSFQLMKLYTTCQDYVYHNSDKSPEVMHDDLLAIVNGRPRRKATLQSLFDAYAKNKYHGTQLMLERTLKKMLEFDSRADLDKINKQWLERFEIWLKDNGANTNGVAHHMRNLRAVCNYALDEDLTTNYPFRKYKIKQEQPRKRDLTIEQLRTLKNYPCEASQVIYRDFFMLIFYLQGINIGDLLMLKHDNIKNGRIEYYRRKTKKYYSIKIEPEAQIILDKYKGKDWLLCPLDTNSDYHNWLSHMTKHLRRIGMTVKNGIKATGEPLFPEISSYYARHSWASIAAEIDIPMDVIAQALGHSTPYTTTDIYVNRRLKKIDEANRKVIDYLLQ